jgi:hypothetical protein
MIKSSGFVPVIDGLVMEIGSVYGAYVYGYIWLNRSRQGVFNEPLDIIASKSGVSRSTIIRWVKRLCANDYLVDLTPTELSRPHQYTCTDKVDLDLILTFEVSKSIHPGVSIYTPGGSEIDTPGVSDRHSPPGVSGVSDRHPRGIRQTPQGFEIDTPRHDHHDDDDHDHDKNIIISAHLDAKLRTLWRSVGLDETGLDAMLNHYQGREQNLETLLHAWAEAVDDKRLPTNWGPGLIYKKIFSGHKPPEKQKTFGDEVMELMRLKQAQLDTAKGEAADAEI